MKLVIRKPVAIITVFMLVTSCQNEQKGQTKMTNDFTNTPIPEYTCKKISKKIELTGKLDDPIWQTAEPVKMVDAVSGEPGRLNTFARAP